MIPVSRSMSGVGASSSSGRPFSLPFTIPSYTARPTTNRSKKGQGQDDDEQVAKSPYKISNKVLLMMQQTKNGRISQCKIYQSEQPQKMRLVHANTTEAQQPSAKRSSKGPWFTSFFCFFLLRASARSILVQPKARSNCLSHFFFLILAVHFYSLFSVFLTVNIEEFIFLVISCPRSYSFSS
jgi:hypothetical protein